MSKKRIADQRLEFVAMQANPHAWLLVADNLHSQAVKLYDVRGTERLIRTDAAGKSTVWQHTNRSVFLLSGFALENAIKAFLVYENPSWISNGSLSSRLRSHRLIELQSLSKLIPYKQRSKTVLMGFEAALESWARYPCALSYSDRSDEIQMQERLWNGYLRLMRAYGRRLMVLLEKGWSGPHGFYGRWEFQGDFLDIIHSE